MKDIIITGKWSFLFSVARVMTFLRHQKGRRGVARNWVDTWRFHPNKRNIDPGEVLITLRITQGEGARNYHNYSSVFSFLIVLYCKFCLLFAFFSSSYKLKFPNSISGITIFSQVQIDPLFMQPEHHCVQYFYSGVWAVLFFLASWLQVWGTSIKTVCLRESSDVRWTTEQLSLFSSVVLFRRSPPK